MATLAATTPDENFDPVEDHGPARNDPAFNSWLKARVEEVLADPRPSIPIDEAFARLRELAAARRGANAV